MITKFINEVCKILEIKPPQVSIGVPHFTTSTMIAQCSSDGLTIYLKDKIVNPDKFFAVAHELRHVWQAKCSPDILNNYKTVDLCSSVDEYNSQPAETDANAFALIVMNTFFGLQPQFNGLAEATKDKIKQRAQFIADGYN